ncbi:MAG: hypothetical protein HQL81_09995 [Magnetococcales bacterium]|nr:hypothetical protein [Magnetococcales bacterium]
MFKLKWMVLAVLPLTVATTVVAEEGREAVSFQEAKKHQIDVMEKKLTCLKAASTRADLVQCHESAKQEHKQFAKERIQEQRRKLDEREKRLDSTP